MQFRKDVCLLNFFDAIKKQKTLINSKSKKINQNMKYYRIKMNNLSAGSQQGLAGL